MKSKILEKSAINFHFTRICNYECKFCFHTKKSNKMITIVEQFEIIKLLRNAGAEKINFAGGEPFLFPDLLGKLVNESKRVGYESVSIISNGSKITRNWMDNYGKALDILGISCDSVSPQVNFDHGRRVAGSSRPRDETIIVKNCAELAQKFSIKFKINTVVTSKNVEETMSNFINEINPIRWKIFQVLDIEGENYNNVKNKNDINEFLITREQFEKYIERNKQGLINKDILVAENNSLMRDSYILIDEFGQFLDVSSGGKVPTRPILEVGLEAAITELVSSKGGGFNKDLFKIRGGYYPENWTK